jgi:DNA invertase Pin-like site-specific DNA recombinase
LTRLASDLGFPPERIVVIDDDLGVSASGRRDRAGFERLVSDVALGRAGIIFGLEVSRLARNNRDWYELLDLCAMKQTLIADADGIYDASAYNDRLLLGLKGTMSEAELHILKGRMLAGLRHKAEKGELRFRLVAGYEYDERGRIIKTSDEQIAHFIELVFAKLIEVGSISGVTKYLQHEGLLVPRRNSGDRTIRWEPAYYRAIWMLATNPIYAGTYVYGRSRVVHDVDGKGRRSHRQVRAASESTVILEDHHPAYVSRETFERIQRMIERNRPAASEQACTALREGGALLQGIVRCGRCGRSMTVRYQGQSQGGVTPVYGCFAAYVQRRAGVCQSMGGRRVDEAIVRVFLEAMSESRLEMEMTALCKAQDDRDAVAEQLKLQLDRARYEAGRHERQYNSVEPENRVVARTLESRWNEALGRVQQLEQQLAERKRELKESLTDQEASRLRELARDLPKLWSDVRVSDRDRKALLRAAIEEVQLRKMDRTVDAKIRWKGGLVTQVSIELIRLRPPPLTPPDLVQLVRQLAVGHSDDQIARILVRRGIKTPMKQLPFNSHRVGDLRRHFEIPRGERRRDETGSLYTVEQAAKLFGVSGPTIYGWLKLGVLEGEQVAAAAPWSIRITAADRERLMAEAPAGWLTLDDAARELAVTKQTILNWVKARNVPYCYATRGRRKGLRINVKSPPKRNQQRLLD